jgi:hypothetical protein
MLVDDSFPGFFEEKTWWMKYLLFSLFNLKIIFLTSILLIYENCLALIKRSNFPVFHLNIKLKIQNLANIFIEII